jgi:hypothetical protein
MRDPVDKLVPSWRRRVVIESEERDHAVDVD